MIELGGDYNYHKEIENNPKDLNLRYQFAVLKFDNNEYEEAINILLDIIMIDRNWNGKSAHDFLIKIFNFLGADNKITIEGRKKLTKILY